MKTVVCLGGNVEAVPIIQRVREMGIRAVIVDGNPNCAAFVHFLGDGGCDYCCASCYNAADILNQFEFDANSDEYAGPFHAVLCAAIDAPVVAAEIAAAFGLPGMSVEAARLSCDKREQIHVLLRADIPVPWYSEVLGGENLQYWMHDKIMLVAKPVDSRGGRGVVRLLPGVEPAWAYEQAKSHSPTGRVMVEQWLDGPQLSTESIVQNGRVLFTAAGLRNYSRLDEFAPYVIEDGFDEPWQNPEWPQRDMYYEINQLVESACRALGWYQTGAGTVKGDLVIHNGRVYVIELAARLSGGFFATHGHPPAYDIDFVGAAVKAALGETLEEPKPRMRGFVSQRYVFPEPGDIGRTVMGIPGKPFLGLDFDRIVQRNLIEMFKEGRIAEAQGSILENLESEPVLMTWNIRPGDVIHPVTDHPARWGQALATGRTPDEARRHAEAAVAAMKARVALK